MLIKRFVTMTAIAAALAIPAATGGFAQSAGAPTPGTPAVTPLAPKTAAPSAATPAAPHAASTAVAPQAARHIGNNEMRASKLTGSAVYD